MKAKAPHKEVRGLCCRIFDTGSLARRIDAPSKKIQPQMSAAHLGLYWYLLAYSDLQLQLQRSGKEITDLSLFGIPQTLHDGMLGY